MYILCTTRESNFATHNKITKYKLRKILKHNIINKLYTYMYIINATTFDDCLEYTTNMK